MSATVNRLPLACLAVLLFVSTALTQGPGAAPQDLGATYIVGHRFGSSSLTMEGDGSYSIKSGDCTREYLDSGTYVLNGGVLNFTVLKKTAKGRGVEGEINLLDPKGIKELYGDSATGEINREFKLLPIRWGGRVYLIYESELANFVNAINLGLEPRSGLSAEPYYGSFYLRQGDEQKKVTGGPDLPGEWPSFLLSKPVTATVVGLEGGPRERVATVNRGSRHGLKVGMRLVAGDEEPSPWLVTEVVSVEEKSAKLRIGNELKLGDKLSTRFERRDVYR